MVISNIKDLLLKSLNKTNKTSKVIESIIYNSIIEVFMDKKNIDIKDYIISIKIINNIIIISTNKPIINSEIKILEEDIIKNIQKKIKNIWIIFDNFKFKYK